MFPRTSNWSIIWLMKIVPAISISILSCLILALLVEGVFVPPVLAPSLDTVVLGAQTGSETSENSNTYTLLYLPSIDDSSIEAKSYLVFDQNSGAPLALRSPNSPLPIASLTKLMTGYLVNKYGNLSEQFTVPEKSVFTVSPVLGLPAGETVKVSDLFSSMIVGSANDAALILAAYLEQKQNQPITELMNQEASSLGMRDTHFSNPLGFDSETNYSTAQDLKILVQAILSYQTFSDLDRLQTYSFTAESGKTYTITATNKLLAGDSEIHAVKTGFTNEAQGAMITSIHHSTGSFVIIVLGSDQREQDTKILKTQIIKTYYSGNP